MLKFLKRNKKAELGKDYIPLDAGIYLKVTNPDRLSEVKEGAVFPFFIQLINAPFENWVIELTQATTGFGTIINSVPKTITDRDIQKLRSKLKRLISNIICDIISDINPQT